MIIGFWSRIEKKSGKKMQVFMSAQFCFYNKGNKMAFLYKQDEEVKWMRLSGKLSEEVTDGFDRIPQYYVLTTEHSVYGYILHEDFEETYLYDYEYKELLFVLVEISMKIYHK